MSAPFSFRVESLGCKSNRYEADALIQFFLRAGGHPAAEGEPADIALLNSCTVTHEAGRKSEQLLRRLRRENPQGVVAVMGCHAQLKDLSGIADLCTGTDGRLSLGEACVALWRKRQGEAGQEGENNSSPAALAQLVAISEAGNVTGAALHGAQEARHFTYEELGLVAQQSETRVQIKIADGCDQFCSYCAICLARGAVRSRSREAILAEARALLAKGAREIVLTATHLASFEKDKGRDSLALAELLEELDTLPGLLRIRLGSLEPRSMDRRFVQAISGLKHLCPHFHLSIQAGSDAVLKAMHRHYGVADVYELVAALREHFPDPAFSCDLMVAFPGETEEDFQGTLRLAEELQLQRLHVFRYSPRACTLAAKMPQIPAAVAKERSERLIALGERLAAAAAAACVGQEEEVILESPRADGRFPACTARYLPCLLTLPAGAGAASGQLWRGRVRAAQGDTLLLDARERVQDP